MPYLKNDPLALMIHLNQLKSNLCIVNIKSLLAA